MTYPFQSILRDPRPSDEQTVWTLGQWFLGLGLAILAGLTVVPFLGVM